MVWGVCRRILRNYHDAEDAFQATFLVLVRKAASVLPRGMVANWLYGVARQTALKARATTARRQGRERQVATMPEPAARDRDLWCDLQPLLDEELSRLPDKYRAVLVLCDLEGKTRKEAARQLHVPEGTVAGQLARARTMLARRLARRGLVLSGGVLAAVVSQQAAAACVPASVVSSTIKVASTFAAGKVAATGVISVKVAILTEGVLKAMLLSKLKTTMAGLLLVAALASGVGVIYRTQAAEPSTERQPGEQRQGPQAEDADKQKLPKHESGKEAKKENGAKHDAAKTDLDRLQGIWSVVSIESGGKPSKLDKAVFMVDGKRACWQTSEYEIQGGLYLEPTSKPKSYDLATTTRTIEGIYSVEDDTLRLCYDAGTGIGSKRPSRFLTDGESRHVLVLLKRTHGPEVFPFRLPDGTRAFPTIIEGAKAPPPALAPQPKAPRVIYQTQTAPQPKAERRNDTITNVSTSQEIRPPKAAEQREYAIMSRLLEGGADEPKEVLRLPKVTVDDGQACPLGFVEADHFAADWATQNLREKEGIKIGSFFNLRVRHLGGNKVRLILSYERNEVDKSTDKQIRVLGKNVQTVQEVELHKRVRILLQKDAEGWPQRWVELTVNEQIKPAPTDNGSEQ
jgi:RNA polymerase sigma factor (sigma-70 family)